MLFKICFPIKAQPNNFFRILFRQCNNIYNLQLWAKFQGKIPSGKWYSHFWWEILCCEMGIGFLGRHFVIVCPIFDLLLYFFFFWLLYQWPALHRQIHSGKYFSELGPIGTPLTTSNGSTLYLDHSSFNKKVISKISVYFNFTFTCYAWLCALALPHRCYVKLVLVDAN